VNDKTDAFDRWRDWAEKPLDSDITIPAEIHNAVMTLTPESRRERATVNAAVRNGMRSAGSTDIYDGAPWTEEDIEEIKNAVAHGSTVEDIAELICRSGSIDGVERKAKELGLKPQRRKARPNAKARH
jgi:hypothetical protein